MARLYRPNLRPTIRASVAILCAALGAVLLLAMTWHQLGSLGDMIFVGTIARGLIIGILLTWVVASTGFAHARAAAWIAGIATLLAIVGAHYQGHRTERAVRMQEAETLLLQREGFGNDRKKLQAEFEEMASALTFANYLRDYFGMTSNDQTEAVDGTASKAGPGPGIGLYLVELLAALLVAAYYPAGRASEPACRLCDRWYQERELPPAAHGVSPEFIAALLANNATQAIALLEPPDTAEYVGLSLASCPTHCETAAPVLRIRDYSFPRGSRELSSHHRADLELDEPEHHQLMEHT